MAQMTLQQAIEMGIAHHQAGRLRLAKEMYEQVLKFDPQNVDALHLLGVLAHQGSDSNAAAELIGKAIAINGDIALMHYNLAEAYRALGRHADAEASLKRALELEPLYFQAQNNLSMVLYSLGRYEESADAARRAVQLEPDHASPHNNLANALRALGRTEESIEEALHALELRQEFPEALNNLGLGYARQDRFVEAMVAYRRAIKLKPEFAEAYANLGAALGRVGKYEEAIECSQIAIRLRPDYSEAYNNLAGALRAGGQMDQSILCYEKAVALRPAFPEAINNLAITLMELRRLDEALQTIQRAIELKPDFADAHYNHGIILKEMMRLDDAADALLRATELDPEHFGALSALGIIRMEQGRLDEGMQLLRSSLKLRKDWQIHSNLCLLLNYRNDVTSDEVLQEHKRWDTEYGKPAKPIAPHLNDRSPERRLRIGYVSPDFKSHAVSHFTQPLLTTHDRSQVEVYCYSHVGKPDPVTHLLQRQSDQWRDIFGHNDELVEKMIRDDQIDILVDLAGHTAHNRLTLFGRKPAPIQISMVGYPCTTGLAAMDYKISDERADPPDAQRFYSEKLIRLAGSFWCFAPLDDLEGVGELPASTTGRITFGSVNNFAKVTPIVLELWARILKAVPNSRLHMQSSALGAPSTQQYVRSVMAKHGVSDDQIVITGWTNFSGYIDLIRSFDIALDPFPFNGGTTTAHLLFYGVPIVTLAGERQISRMGVSMLHSAGQRDLIAESLDDYFQKATALATDIPRLGEIRRTLRQRMLASPLCDAHQHVRQLESAYREMWRDWCAKSPASASPA